MDILHAFKLFQKTCYQSLTYPSMVTSKDLASSLVVYNKIRQLSGLSILQAKDVHITEYSLLLPVVIKLK